MTKTELKRAERVAAQDDELSLLAARAKGPLRAKRVVQFAANPKTALHQHFEWDNTVAGQKYRLHQAEMLLTTRMVVLESATGPIEVRAFLHLPSEGGYRATDRVMHSEEMRAEIAAYYRQRLAALQRDARNIALLANDPLYQRVQAVLESDPIPA